MSARRLALVIRPEDIPLFFKNRNINNLNLKDYGCYNG